MIKVTIGFILLSLNIFPFFFGGKFYLVQSHSKLPAQLVVTRLREVIDPWLRGNALIRPVSTKSVSTQNFYPCSDNVIKFHYKDAKKECMYLAVALIIIIASLVRLHVSRF